MDRPEIRATGHRDEARTLSIIGPAGSGKTSKLAERAREWARRAPVTAICSNAASCAAFERALRILEVAELTIIVDTLAGHAARWMRTAFAASGASPELMVGGDADSVALAREAGRSILDMTWLGFRAPDFDLDLPLVAREDMFFEEAAALFRQLRRWHVKPDEFEASCISGTTEFYGDDVERALERCADRDVRSRASSRGRDALSADASRMRRQRRAERDLASMLAFVYREYVAGARGRRVLCADDIIDECVRWLRSDACARASIVERAGALVIDDAEDSEPSAGTIVELLREAGLERIAVASNPSGAIEGISGRRPLVIEDAERVHLPPRSEVVARTATRYADENAEADAIATSIRDLLRDGTRLCDILVLARDEGGAAVYAQLLTDRGVPVIASPSAWQAPADIADLLALACIVDDPYDHAHLLRVLASPLVGLSDHSLLTLCRDPVDARQLALDVGLDDKRLGGGRGIAPTTLAENVLYGHVDLRLSGDACVSVRAFRERWGVWRAECARRGVASALSYLMDTAGFLAAWHSSDEHVRSRLANDAQRLIAAAAASGGSLGDVARALESGSVRIEPAAPSGDAVSCRTIAGAKGLRAQYVFVAGVAHERFPRIYVSRGLAFSKRWGLIVRENVAVGASQTAKFAWYYARHGAKKMYLDEERRALDYALSRADVHAFASGFGSPPRWAVDHDLLKPLGA